MARDDPPILDYGQPATPARLDYAPQGGDESARFEAAVNEAFIPGRGGPRTLLPFFDRDPERTAWYFGKQLSRRFDGRSLTDFCNGCGTAEKDNGVVCWWRVEVRARSFAVSSVDATLARATARSMHTLCEPCWKRFDRRLALGCNLEWWSWRLLCVGWIAAFLGFVALMGLQWMNDTVAFCMMISMALVTIGLISGYVWGGIARAAAVPRGIKRQLPVGLKFDTVYDWLPRFQLMDSSKSFGGRAAVRRAEKRA